MRRVGWIVMLIALLVPVFAVSSTASAQSGMLSLGVHLNNMERPFFYGEWKATDRLLFGLESRESVFELSVWHGHQYGLYGLAELTLGSKAGLQAFEAGLWSRTAAADNLELWVWGGPMLPAGGGDTRIRVNAEVVLKLTQNFFVTAGYGTELSGGGGVGGWVSTGFHF